MENRAKGYGEICEVLYEFENSVNLFLERASEIEKGDSDNEIKIMAMKRHAYGKIRGKIAEIDDSFKAKKGLLEEVLQKSETLLGKMKLPARLINPTRTPAGEYQDFTILGPTCDNLDILPAPFYLPVDAQEGDWIEIGQTGAYSNSAATRFNGFFPETFVSVDAPPLLPD